MALTEVIKKTIFVGQTERAESAQFELFSLALKLQARLEMNRPNGDLG